MDNLPEGPKNPDRPHPNINLLTSGLPFTAESLLELYYSATVPDGMHVRPVLNPGYTRTVTMVGPSPETEGEATYFFTGFLLGEHNPRTKQTIFQIPRLNQPIAEIAEAQSRQTSLSGIQQTSFIQPDGTRVVKGNPDYYGFISEERVREKLENTRIAAGILNPHGIQTPHFVATFMTENPNIAGYVSYLPGNIVEALPYLLRNSQGNAQKLAALIGNALKFLHGNNFVHNQLTLGNMFLDEREEQIYITDFSTLQNVSNHSTKEVAHPDDPGLKISPRIHVILKDIAQPLSYLIHYSLGTPYSPNFFRVSKIAESFQKAYGISIPENNRTITNTQLAYTLEEYKGTGESERIEISRKLANAIAFSTLFAESKRRKNRHPQKKNKRRR